MLGNIFALLLRLFTPIYLQNWKTKVNMNNRLNNRFIAENWNENQWKWLVQWKIFVSNVWIWLFYRKDNHSTPDSYIIRIKRCCVSLLLPFLHWMSFSNQIAEHFVLCYNVCDKITHCDTKPAECFIIVVVITPLYTIMQMSGIWIFCLLFKQSDSFYLLISVLSSIV